MTQVEDGTGRGYRAAVDPSNRLLTKAIMNCDCKDVSQETAQSYEFATGAFLAPTATSEHAIFYVKNTSSTLHLHIHEIRTCGSVVQRWILYKNDTGGTIVSDANAGVEVNHNFASSNVADADVFSSCAAGKTRSCGFWMSQNFNDFCHSNI